MYRITGKWVQDVGYPTATHAKWNEIASSREYRDPPLIGVLPIVASLTPLSTSDKI